MNEFLVRYIENKKNYWIDLDNGQQFEKCKIPYSMAKHGLCKTLDRKVLKKIENDGFEPLVFMSVEKTTPKLPKKGISFSYKNDDGMKATWNFTPYEIMQAIEGLNEDMNDRELCIMLFCPREVAKKLRYKLSGSLIEKIEKEIGGEKDGKRKRRTKVITSKRASHIRGISPVSERK